MPDIQRSAARTVMTVVGARPQFIKAAMTSAAIRAAGLHEIIVHTGQHYDPGMSDVFFSQMGIPREDFNLHIGSGSHGTMTAGILQGVEELIMATRPDAVLVFGDTNSTMAAALAAVKLHVPVGHVEAGMRSFNRRMPEEINRVVTDHIATWHYCPNQTAAENLRREGVAHGIEVVGDVMTDALVKFSSMVSGPPALPGACGLVAGSYVCMTCHRAENTDDKDRLKSIVGAAGRIAKTMPVMWPVHPRVGRLLEGPEIMPESGICRVPPLSYLDMIALMKNAAVVLTDSGGMQKEAYLLDVPCITMRDETEWIETVESGWNILAGADTDEIVKAFAAVTSPGFHGTVPKPILFGDGMAADRIAAHLRHAMNRNPT